MVRRAAARLVGLFLSLGWNFLSYGVFNTPEGEGIVWSWAFCGVLFVLMGGVPLVGGLSVFGSAPLRRSLFGADAGGSSATITAIAPRPGPARRPRAAYRPRGGAAGRPDTTSPERAAALAEISADMGAAVAQALDEPALPDERAAPPAADFDEGTQALLDRLERLADLRDRGLLAPDEYETAKETIVRELETRQ